ncbi:hypothetical protein ANRL2_02434 [Anaerolineae bacterium]|nr:hypothetical protein ANRL2_02434 [Anaerolineae bacterium]
MTHELYFTKQGNNAELLDTLMTGYISKASAFGVTYAVSNAVTGSTKLFFKSAKRLAQAKEWALRFASERGINHVCII